jgi:hypothetical protein
MQPGQLNSQQLWHNLRLKDNVKNPEQQRQVDAVTKSSNLEEPILIRRANTH